MIISGGVAVKSPTTLWTGTTSTWGSWPSSLDLGWRFSSYGQLYREQLWVYVVVNKLAKGAARLPLKVYERADTGRPEARGHPYAELLRRPNERHDPFFFWLWSCSTFKVYGESFWAKQRDRGGRPVALLPLHPTGMQPVDERDGEVIWRFQNGSVQIDNIPQHDLVQFKTYNPDSMVRGLSPVEPLRRTLENEDASRRATSAFWKNGARPGVTLTHPGTISEPAASRLKLQWEQVATGADKTGTTVVLEEGMKAEKLTLTAEEAQYIESRKLNREEVCGAYDVPPPVVHILDRATFSNITEQMRSMYRDTMAPDLKAYESTLEMQLRDGRAPGAPEPDFGDEVYAEFLLDEVLRGDFEARQDAYQKADYMTVAEKREKENLPFVDGTERILVNSTMVPLDSLDQIVAGRARTSPPAKTLTGATVRALMGRLSRPTSLADVDLAALVADLNGDTEAVEEQFAMAVAADEDVPTLRARIKAMAKEDAHA